MTRIKIDLPNKFAFNTEIPIRITEINYGGHLGNDAVLSIVHEARVRFLAHFSFSELDIGGAAMIMADTAIVYRSEGFYGDVLEVSVTPGAFSTSSFDLFYLIKNKKTGKEVARIKTGIVCFDYEAKKVRPVPEKFKRLFL